MAKQSKRPAGSGRPPTGLKGEKISTDYHSVRLRVPPDVRIAIDSASTALGLPQWRVWIDAFRAYIGEGQTLTEAKQRAVRQAIATAQRARRVNGD